MNLLSSEDIVLVEVLKKTVPSVLVAPHVMCFFA